MTSDILGQEQLKIELTRVLSKFFLPHLEELLRIKTGVLHSVKRISEIKLGKRLGRRGELQLVTGVVCSVNNEEFDVDLAFKFVTDPELSAKEGNGSIWLGDVLKNNIKVHTPQLLYFSHQNSLLIYEGLSDTQEYLESKLDQPQKLFLTGLSLPYIHGIFKNQVFLDRYLHLITSVVDGLHMSPSDRDELYSLFKGGLVRVGKSQAGANCFGDFHPGNIMFKETNTISTNTGDLKIDSTEVYLIDPAYIDTQGNVDRTEDIGTFFSKFAYNDYYISESFDRTVDDFEVFLKGYNYTLSNHGLKFNDFYPEGLTLDFHIGLGILIDTMFKIKIFVADNIQDRVSKSLDATKYVLKNSPFDILD
ncbi:MAG: hypothetical protein ACTSR2_11685 [Candidatus Hodarchaeales archaeon]